MYIFQDFRNKKFISVLSGILVGNTYRAIFLFRCSSWFYTHKIKALGVILWSINISLHGCDISPNATIGSGFSMDHSVGVVIGGGVKAGKNLRVFQNSTIGAGKTWDYPEIGDNVTIYAGAALLGKIKIGSNAKIGANAVVLIDVPKNATAVGVPARVIEKTALS